MKYAMSLVLVLSAGVAATRESHVPGALARGSNAEAAQAYGVAPWLSEAWQDVVDEGDEDPHAGLMAGDPHAGLELGPDPSAGMCPRSDDDVIADHPGELGEADPGSSNVHASVDPNAHAGGSPHGRTRGPELGVGAVARSPASNGFTVADIFAQRAVLQARRVALRATVVRRMDGVMGKTFLHLQDGTGTLEQANFDLTATTQQEFAIGETVEVEGELNIDQDLGAGYVYPALLEHVQRLELH